MNTIVELLSQEIKIQLYYKCQKTVENSWKSKYHLNIIVNEIRITCQIHSQDGIKFLAKKKY